MMDRIESMWHYCQMSMPDEPANEAIVETAVTVAGTVALSAAIYGIFNLASKGASKVVNAVSGTKAAQRASAAVNTAKEEATSSLQARCEKRKEEKRKAQNEAFLKESYRGRTNAEWLEFSRKFESKYGPIIIKLHDQWATNVLNDVAKLRKSDAQYKDIPNLISIDRANSLDDLYMYFDPKEPDKSYSYMVLGDFVPTYNVDGSINDIEDMVDSSLFVDDTEKRKIIRMAQALLKRYTDAQERIIDKHTDTFVSQMEKLGIKVTNVRYEHISDEFLFEEVQLDTAVDLAKINLR
jgi:hypothetical protein